MNVSVADDDTQIGLGQLDRWVGDHLQRLVNDSIGDLARSDAPMDVKPLTVRLRVGR